MKLLERGKSRDNAWELSAVGIASLPDEIPPQMDILACFKEHNGLVERNTRHEVIYRTSVARVCFKGGASR